MTVRFTCNGCGKCCRDHHVPLTLDEARQWAEEGGQVAILAEAFLENGLGVPLQQREHAQRRAWRVPCGEAHAYLAVTFAAYNLGACRHLQADNRCAIYARRPLVCQIYPAEINPHIALRQELKECAAETWLSGPALIIGGKPADARLAALIERSRQADRDDICRKVAICEHLGIGTAALKGDGFALYLPAVAELLAAMDTAPQAPAQQWSLHVSNPQLARQLEAAGARIAAALGANGTFIALQQAA